MQCNRYVAVKLGRHGLREEDKRSLRGSAIHDKELRGNCPVDTVEDRPERVGIRADIATVDRVGCNRVNARDNLEVTEDNLEEFVSAHAIVGIEVTKDNQLEDKDTAADNLKESVVEVVMPRHFLKLIREGETYLQQQLF